jgi:hypothetical protein
VRIGGSRPQTFDSWYAVLNFVLSYRLRASGWANRCSICTSKYQSSGLRTQSYLKSSSSELFGNMHSSLDYIYMYTIGLYPPAHWLTYAMYHISLIREIEWNWRRWHPNNHVPALRSSRRVSFQMNYKKLGGGHPKCDGKLGHHWRTELLKTRSTTKPKIIWSGRM